MDGEHLENQRSPASVVARKYERLNFFMRDKLFLFLNLY